MKIDVENNNHITAEDGKIFQRISDNRIMGKEIWLGYTHYLNGAKLDEPLLELSSHFREINEDEVDDTPVITEDNPMPITEEENIGEDENIEWENPSTITVGDIVKMKRQIAELQGTISVLKSSALANE